MKVPTFALRAIAKGRAKLPWILAANGVVLTVKACYDFYKAAPKCKQVLEEYRQWEAEIKEAKEKAKTEAVTTNYTEKEAKREHAANMLKTAIGFAKIFAPGVIDLMAACGSFGYSMKILNGRYVAVAARSAQQSRYIDHIEKGIVAAYGADALHKIQHGDPEAPQVIDNDGEPVEKEDAPLPPRKPEQILFTEGNPNFEDTPFKNNTFVTGIQNRLNDVLVHRMKIAQVTHPGKPGWLFENEIRTALGEPITGDGQVYGKLYWPTEELNKKYGGSLLDFGLDDIKSVSWQDAKWRFKNGVEASIILDLGLYPEPIIDMI